MGKAFARFNCIDSARGLAWLAESVRAGRHCDNDYICLVCDIDLGGYAKQEGWKPIGSEAVPFVGTFDGCGHMITGLRINRPAKDYQGLFGIVSDSGIVKNIRLRDSHVVGRDFTGSVAGCVNSGSLRNIGAIGYIHGCHMVGGIVGNSINSYLESNRFQGHIVGRNYTGGISGATWRSNIVNNLNMSSNVKGRDYVGGITGSLFGGDLESCRCTGCINGYNFVGGMAGKIGDGNVLGCTVACSVEGKNMVGAAGGLACGNNLIENCVFACSALDGTNYSVNIADQAFTYEPESEAEFYCNGSK